MSESGWFLAHIRRSLLAPRAFALALAAEHFGLAGLLVAIAAGASLSLGMDLLVMASRGLDPLTFLPRLLTDALFMSARIPVLAALLGVALSYGLRPIRRDDAPSAETAFTAVAFSLSPLLAALPLGLVAVVAPALGSAVAVLGLVLAARVVYGLVVNVVAIAPLAPGLVASAALAVALAFGLADQVDRGRFVTYAYLPQLAPALDAAPAQGTAWSRSGVSLVVPERWHDASGATSGQLGRFETDKDSLTVTFTRAGGLLIPSDVADRLELSEMRGLSGTGRRDVVRIGDMIVVDDSRVGVYEGRRVALRQFTTVRGGVGYALIFRSIEPDDADALLAEDARIAATWRIAGRP